MSALFLPLLLLTMALSGCTGGGGGAPDLDDTDDGPGYGDDGNGTGNSTMPMPEEQMCENATSSFQVGDRYFKTDGNDSVEVYEESNGIEDLQTPYSCPANPDRRVA